MKPLRPLRLSFVQLLFADHLDPIDLQLRVVPLQWLQPSSADPRGRRRRLWRGESPYPFGLIP